MEDSHSVHLFLPPKGDKSATPNKPATNIPAQPAGSTVTNDNNGTDGNAFIGVFDGHGGAAVAKFTGTTIHDRLAALEAYSKYLHRVIVFTNWA
jgi:protein phosphatase 2C family protein 2/3